MKFSGNPVTAPTSHLEKKNELLESLRKQVLVIKGLLEKQELFAKTDIEILLPLLDKEHEESLAVFDGETITQYRNYMQLREESSAVSGTLDEIDLEQAGREESLEYEDRYNRAQYLWDKAESLFSVEVSFVEHIENFFTRIKEIARRTAEIRSKKQSAGDISVYLGSQGKLYGEFLPEDIVEVDEDAFSTAFILKEDAWLKEHANSAGFYRLGTDSIFILDSPDKNGIKETLKHERMHHLLDGIARYEIREPSKMALRILKRVGDLQKMNAPIVLIESQFERLVGRNFAKQMINSTQNEFLAEYEEGKRKGFGRTPELELLDDIFGVDQDADRRRLSTFKDTARTLSTAGHHILKGHKALMIIIKSMQDGGLDEFVHKAERQKVLFEELFLTMIDQVRQAGKYSKILGEDVDTEIKALLILLEPTSYHHIDTYLRYEYEDMMAIIDANKRIFFSGDVSHDTLQQLNNFLRSSKVEITKDSMKRIYEVVQNYLYEESDNFDGDSGEHPKKAISILREWEEIVQQKTGEHFEKGKFAREYFIESLVPRNPRSLNFNEIPDNFFEGEDETFTQEFIKGNVFEEEFDEEGRQDALKLFKRVGLL